MDTGVIVVLTTAGSEDQADVIARGLVEAELAACVNIVPRILSTYRWQGSVTRDEEWLLIVKTTADRFEAVRAKICERHSYELPEVIALPVVDADPAILDWYWGVEAAAEGDSAEAVSNRPARLTAGGACVLASLLVVGMIHTDGDSRATGGCHQLRGFVDRARE